MGAVQFAAAVEHEAVSQMFETPAEPSSQAT